MKKRALMVFLGNLLVSTVASLVVPWSEINRAAVSGILMALGFGSLFYLHDNVRVIWGWAVLWGSVGSNMFERLVFGSVYDWIPLGIGYANTADFGILIGLGLILKGGKR